MMFCCKTVAVCGWAVSVVGTDTSSSAGTLGKRTKKKNSRKVTSSMSSLPVWVDLETKIDQRKSKWPSQRMHFCSVCGLDCTQKNDVLIHAERYHGKTHCTFSLKDVIPLQDVCEYYHFIKKLKKPCSRARHFIKTVEQTSETKVAKKVLSPSAKKTQPWLDLQAKVDKHKNNISSQRMHFCPICGTDCSQTIHVFKHAQRKHKDTNPDFILEDVVLLDSVEKYYHFISNLKKPCARAKHFIKMVNDPILVPKAPRALPAVVKEIQQWIDLQTKIEKSRHKSPSLRAHFCRVCGIDYGQKIKVLEHGKKYHKNSHSDFCLEDALILNDVEKYYNYITSLKNPHPKVEMFVSGVEQEINTAQKEDNPSNREPHEPYEVRAIRGLKENESFGIKVNDLDLELYHVNKGGWADRNTNLIDYIGFYIVQINSTVLSNALELLDVKQSLVDGEDVVFTLQARSQTRQISLPAKTRTRKKTKGTKRCRAAATVVETQSDCSEDEVLLRSARSKRPASADVMNFFKDLDHDVACHDYDQSHHHGESADTFEVEDLKLRPTGGMEWADIF